MTFPVPSHPKVLAPGDGEYVVLGGNAKCTFKITGEDTRGQLGLFEFEMAEDGVGASPHIHHELTEIFYVLEGSVELRAGNVTTIGTPGATLVVPPSTPHAFKNVTGGPAKVLILFCPAQEREKYFTGMAELTKDGRSPTKEELLTLMRAHDQEPVEMPEDV